MHKFHIYIFSFTMMLISCNSKNHIPLTNGVSKELAEQRFSNLTNIEYDLHLELPQDKEQRILATLQIRVNIKDISSPLILDFKSDSTKISNLIINNIEGAYVYEQEHLIISNENLIEGENKISFQFIAGDQSLNRNDNYMYTLLVPDRARTLFPCFDQPDLKAKYILSLSMPKNWEAIAGEYGKTTKVDSTRKVILFKQTKPISTYLFSFVAGEFKRIEQTVDNRKYSMLHLEEEEDIEINKAQIFKLHAQSVRWMEDYTGISLPFNKLDFALIPPFQYGGMEHVGAIQYRASSLILDENAGPSEKLRRAQLIAHEVAHMWFGNLVTMKWFDDVWLKEVFANFIAAKAITPSYPDINHNLQFFLSHQYRAYEVDRTAGTHPIQQNLDNLNLAGTLYGAIIYCKAPVVMAQLELLVGEDNLRKSLQIYLNKYAYSNATFDDLISVISETSKVDLKNWANQWVKNEGIPHYIVDRDQEEISIKTKDFSKSQKITNNGKTISLDKKHIKYKNNIGTFPLDNSGKNYGYFELSTVLIRELKENISKYSETEKAIAYSTLWDNFLNDKFKMKSYRNFLLKRLLNEKNLLLKKQLLDQFNEIYWYYSNAKEQQNISVEYFYIFKNEIEQSTNKAIQTFYFKAISLLLHQPNQIDYFHQYLFSKETIPSLNDRERINLLMKLRLEGYYHHPTDIVRLKELLTSNYYQQYLDFILPSTSDLDIEKDAFFEGLKKETNRNNEPWVENALYFLNHPLNANNSLKNIRTTLEILPQIQKTGDIFFPYNYLKNSIGVRSEKQVIDWTTLYLQNNDIDVKLKNKILQNLDPVIRRQNH